MGADLYIKMIADEESGYFRDSYNDSNLLWQLDLDYWEWFETFLNKSRELTPGKARQVLREIKERKHILDAKKGLYEAELRQHSEKKYQELVKFLEKAIELRSNIECSI